MSTWTSRMTSRMTSRILGNIRWDEQGGIHAPRVPHHVYSRAAKATRENRAKVKRTEHSEEVVINRSTRPSMCHRSRSVMATPSQSIVPATLEREREGELQERTQGLGVTTAALDIFSNFVQLVATNAETASVAFDNLQPSKPLPRRSRRFEPREEAPIQCAQTLPTPPQQQVRFLACLPCVSSPLWLGFGPT